MARFFKGKRKKKKSRIKKRKNLDKCRTVCLNFIEYKGKGGGYPKLNLWMNEEEKEYLENVFWDNIALYTSALEMTKEERKNKSDFELVLNRLEQSNKYYRNNRDKVHVG